MVRDACPMCLQGAHRGRVRLRLPLSPLAVDAAMNHAARTLSVLLAAALACNAYAQQADHEATPGTPGHGTAEAGATTTPPSLVYTPLAPCRLLDTREPSLRSGRFQPREERSFYSNVVREARAYNRCCNFIAP